MFYIFWWQTVWGKKKKNTKVQISLPFLSQWLQTPTRAEHQKWKLAGCRNGQRKRRRERSEFHVQRRRNRKRHFPWQRPHHPTSVPVRKCLKWRDGLETQRTLSFVGTQVRNSDGALWLRLSMQGPTSDLSLSLYLSHNLSISRLLLFSLWSFFRHP